MSRIPLQFLPAFRAAAELQNLRAAAAALHVTPSAISQQIQTLESQLGFDLFDREGRKVVLNAAGAVFLRSVQAALAEWTPVCRVRRPWRKGRRIRCCA